MPRRVTLLLVFTLSSVFLVAAPALAGSVLQPTPIQPIKQPYRFVTPSPDEVEFGAVDVHGNSAHQTITFEDSFPKPVEEKISSVNLAAKPDSGFQIVSDGCSGKVLLRSPESCSVEVSFAPGIAGARGATLELVVEEYEEGQATGEVLEEVEVPLRGEGVIGTLSANPSPLVFSPIPYSSSGTGGEGEQNETEQVTILNSKAGTQVEAVSITGPDASSFSVQYGNCEKNFLQVNNTCDEGIRFQPVSPGVKHAQLEITSDSPESPLVVPLEGEGLLGPRVTLSPPQALLGEVPIGGAVSQTFTLSNTGDYPLGVQQAALVSGTPLMFPLISDTCSGKVIKPGAACAVTVDFQPTSTGEKNASILFITGGSMPLKIVGIEGIGVQPGQPSVTTPTGGIPAATSLQVLLVNPSPPPPVASPPTSPWPARLAIQGPARMFGAGGGTVESGVGALCPATSTLCEVQSYLTTTIATSQPRRGGASTRRVTVLLGTATTLLRGGTDARVHIPLSAQAIALLRQRGHLRARLGVIIRAGSQAPSTRTRTLTLVG